MSFTLVASPRGARVGFTTAGGPHHQVLVTVAPKAWRVDPRNLVTVSAWPTDRQHNILLYETDRLSVTAPDLEIEQLLQQCVYVSNRDGPEWGESLLMPELPPTRARLTYACELPVDNDVTVTDVLQLFERVALLTPPAAELTASAKRSPLHRPLLARRFLDDVLRLLNSARRGYQPVTSVRSTIRGRVEPVSAMRYMQIGDPRLVCHYNELTESTPLLGVIAAGLEWVADGQGARSVFAGQHAEPKLRHDAISLRRALGDIATMATPAARLLGPRLHLNRLDRPWHGALTMSLSLLAETEHVASNEGAHRTDPAELSVPTSILWETIVGQVLSRAGFDEVLDQRSQPNGMVCDPWLAEHPTRTNTRPDFVARRGPDLWIIDAKYKIMAQGMPPSRDDQYQMFAYSHLVAEESHDVPRTVLVYADSEPSRTWRRGRDVGSEPHRLMAIHLPFPRPADVRGSQAWHRYLSRTADLFEQAVLPT